ncbi:DUF456 domain-containing protein [Mycolicibacterium tusciae]|uniref:DUF456 domain-containing protein n=1 Tax=Mycolicibacterium tusciae TaxID=75922 RepID=UPI000488B1A3|nr:DUF456 domain-containing protein [Mycolicibacterium tusciae]
MTESPLPPSSPQDSPQDDTRTATASHPSPHPGWRTGLRAGSRATLLGAVAAMFAGALLFGAGLYVGAEFAESDGGYLEPGATSEYRDTEGGSGDENKDTGDGERHGENRGDHEEAAPGNGGDDEGRRGSTEAPPAVPSPTP